MRGIVGSIPGRDVENAPGAHQSSCAVGVVGKFAGA